MVMNFSFRNFSLLCLAAAASLVLGASALAYSVPRAPLAAVASAEPTPVPALER
jgi:hypothetical protein